MSLTGVRGTAAAWDEFLASSARGQFQQTSGWAEVKAREGWSAVLQYLDPIDPSCGGFQLLWKRSRLGKIGYVSKGPVLPDETGAAVAAAIEGVTSAARRMRLVAVVVQPPDDSLISSEALVHHGFFFRPIESVIRATGIIDLAGGADGVVSRMSHKARQQWRSASRRRVTLRWGTRNDLPEFFRLMCESCRRQRAVPNPGRVELLVALWDAFPGRASLAFAEHDGRQVAGLLMIGDGGRLVLWKKGWDSEEPRLFASQFLMSECLSWASRVGYACADVVSMSLPTAARIMSHHEMPEAECDHRDVFNLRFGAKPKMLPPAHLLILNPVLRRIAYAGLRWPRLRSALERRIR